MCLLICFPKHQTCLLILFRRHWRNQTEVERFPMIFIIFCDLCRLLNGMVIPLLTQCVSVSLMSVFSRAPVAYKHHLQGCRPNADRTSVHMQALPPLALPPLALLPLALPPVASLPLALPPLAFPSLHVTPNPFGHVSLKFERVPVNLLGRAPLIV